jgi:hypothetical protein
MKTIIKENLIDIIIFVIAAIMWFILPVVSLIIIGLHAGSKLRPTRYFEGFMAIYFLLVCAYCVAAAMDKINWFYYLN